MSVPNIANSINSLKGRVSLLEYSNKEITNDILAVLKRNIYEILTLKHSRNSLKISNAMQIGASTDQIKQLTKTSWTEGKVRLTFESVDDDPNYNMVVRWKRSWNDIEFDHEISTMLQDVDINEDVQNITGVATQGDPQYDSENNPILDSLGNQVYSWNFTPAPETRYMPNGGDLLEQVAFLVTPRILYGDIGLSVSFDNGIPRKFFNNHQTRDLDKRYTESWYHISGTSRPPSTAGMVESEWISPELINTVASNPDNNLELKKVLHVDRQESYESNVSYFSRLFGPESSKFIENIPSQSQTFTMSGTGNASDAQMLGVLASCGFTRNADRVVSLNTVGVGTSISVLQGRIIIGGEILYGGIDPPPLYSQEIYSLWANNDNFIDDYLMVSLPSNVIHSGNITDIVNHGTPSRPHARLPTRDEIREYKYPTNPKCVYLNYVKVESNSVATGFGGSNTAGSSVWLFWRPGFSIYCFGAQANSNIELTKLYTDNSNPNGLDDTPFMTHGLEWAAMQLVEGIDGVGFSSPPISPQPQYILDLYPKNFITNLGDGVNNADGITVNYLTAVAGVPVSPISCFVGRSHLISGSTTKYNDRAVFAALSGATQNAIDQVNPPIAPVIPTYIQRNHANIVSIGSSNACCLVLDLSINSIIPKQLITHNLGDLDQFDLTESDLILGLFDYGSIRFKNYQRDGELKSLFPPLWYLQTSQNLSPELRNLTQRLNHVEQYINEYVQISIEATLTSIEKLGLVDELISRKIIFLEEEIKIRYDQLLSYIDNAVSSLTELIDVTSASGIDLLTKHHGGGNGGDIFLKFFIQIAPTILGMIPVVGSLAAGITKVATDIGTSEYKAAFLAETTSRLISRASRLIQQGDQERGMAMALYGTLSAATFTKAFTREAGGEKLITTDVDGNIISNVKSVLEPSLLPLGIINVSNVQTATFNDLEGALPNVNALAQANENILAKIRSLEQEEGYTPIYDEAAPMAL
jgi:hypothetical protein